MKILLPLILLALLLPGPAAALELFGVPLESTSRDELREAVKQAGVELVREGGEDQLFDVYDPSPVVPGASRLYLGFEPVDQGMAFVEYEFVGIDTRRLRIDLSAKYGEPETNKGRYLTDQAYRWVRDGIEIHLRVDWSNYRTRLSYVDPAALNALRTGTAPAAGADAAAPVVSFF